VLPDKPSIAVLPFQYLSGDPDQDYFAEGIVEDIITGLSRSKLLFVISRHSSFTYGTKAVDLKRISDELGIRYVLQGSVRKAATRVRVTGQLIDLATGGTIWAERFDSDLEDIFRIARSPNGQRNRRDVPAARTGRDRTRSQQVDRKSAGLRLLSTQQVQHLSVDAGRQRRSAAVDPTCHLNRP
jgi:TolB-like protein